jgi:carbamoylphosphate synthase large subunit
MAADVNVDIARYQKEIIQRLGLESENVIFDFSQNEGVITLNLITVNPRHEQSFLFHSVKAVDKVEALQKMQKYVNQQHKDENTYTVQWRKSGERELHTSYFRAKNMYDALDKFYYNRDMTTYTVFNVALNPVA